jgi:hypothetical protein
VDPIPPGFGIGRLPPSGPFIVQFRYPMAGGEADAVTRAGGTVAGYLPDGAFVVVATPAFPQRAASLPGVRWVGALPDWARLAPGADGAGRLEVLFGGKSGPLVDAVSAAGARLLALDHRSALVDGHPGLARALAALGNVVWVAPATLPAPMNYQAVLTGHLRTPANGSSYTPGAGGMWTFDDLMETFVGYAGTGVTVDVTDQGVDGSHPAFAGRTSAYKSWVAGPDWTDTQGHGTHVAGTAVGSGAYLPADAALPTGYFAGAAPGATLVAQRYNFSSLDYTGMADFASGAGATVSVNAWGDTGPTSFSNYTAASAAYDSLTADASGAPGSQPLLFVFAAGNENQGAGTVLPPATAKNVITVGATGNDYGGGTSSQAVASFSSFGPADDGRIKPDLVAPGERVASANSTQFAGSGVLPLPALGGASYLYLSGTSQSAPQVAGGAAVAQQYLAQARGIAATPALLKAALINGAQPLPGYPWPGPAQGWGRLDLAASLLDSGGHTVQFVREGSYTFSSTLDVYQVDVPVDAGSQLRVTLVWTDAAGTPLAAKSLVNDLDLEVRDPTDGQVFAGNAINTTTAFSYAGGPADHTNNVEAVRVASAAAGTWKVVVRPYNLPAGAQSFAIVASGAINLSARPVEIVPQSPSVTAPPHSLVPLNVTVTNRANTTQVVNLSAVPLWANSSSWSVDNVSVTVGPGASQVAQLALANNDTGRAGMRGPLSLRAVGSGGGTDETQVAVSLGVVSCIDASLFTARAARGMNVTGTVPWGVTLPVLNCGNAPATVTLGVDTSSLGAWEPLWRAVASSATLDPGEEGGLLVVLNASAEVPDMEASVSVTLLAPDPVATASMPVHRRSGVVLNLTAFPSSVALLGRADTLFLTVTNEGLNGTVLAPQVVGAPGTTVVATPNSTLLGPGESWTFELRVERAEEVYPAEESLEGVFDAGGANFTIHATWQPQAPGRPPTGPWPSDLGPAAAVLAGVAVAGAAALLAARTRALPRACPACGQKAPRFDTFMNPSCAGCGAVLAPPGRSR